MNSLIRAATLKDWPNIAALLVSSGLPTDDLDESDYKQFLVAAHEAGITGSIALEPLSAKLAMLRSLAVHVSARNMGLGRALVQRVEAQARSNQFSEIFLLTDTADKFFAQLNYQRMDRLVAPDDVRLHPQFKTLCPASAVLMHKLL